MYVVDQIYRIASETPDRTALVHDLEPVTYRELHLMISRMRARLAAEGVRGGSGVAVQKIGSIKTGWVVNLALRSLGLVTCAINSGEELSALSGLDVVLVVTAAEDGVSTVPAASFPAAPRIVINEADWRGVDDGSPLEPPPVGPQGGHIVFTSGTTGLRKKIMVDTFDAFVDGGFLELYRSRTGHTDFEWRDMMLNLLNFGLWAAGGYGAPVMLWCVGGAVLFHQAEGAERTFAVPGLTYASMTPAMVDQLLAAPESVLPRNDRLMLGITAGALSIPLAKKIRARLTNTVVTSLASTEGGSIALTVIETEDDLRWHQLDPARDVQVVDENHRPLPPGHLGQVRVRQEPWAPREYIDDPVATRAFFRDGWFYPGDLAILDGKGRLALAGRVTDVLVVKGDKIPSGPIEEDFQKQLDLHGVCALSEQAADGTDALHIVLETDTLPDQARLRSVSKPYLAYFPNVSFHNVAAMPRNANGKVDRLRLRQVLAEQMKMRAAE